MSNAYFNHTNRFVKLDTVRAGDVNNVFDNVEAGFDSVETKVDAALKLPDGESASALPVSGTRANKVLTFDGSGNPVATIAAVDVATVAGIASDVEAVSDIAADVTVCADNIAAILDAPTQASAAAASASTALGHANTAQSHANAAATSFDSFDDRYLGAKASDPTLDNDGNALITGALYWNTGASEMRAYSGSAWVATYVPAGNYVTGQALSVDNEIALFSGTGGKTVKRATTTGMLKASSGVLAAAVAGTDFAKPDTASTWTAEQTFKEVTDTVHTIVDGAAFEIDPANGAIQTITLGASRTPAATNFAAGQCVLLGIDDGSGFSITWTTVNPVWVKAGGTASAPALATTGFTWILLWRVGSTTYGTLVGSP